MVDLLGGKIALESEKDKGSTFLVHLPFQIAPDRAIRKPIVHEGESLNDSPALKILLAEDNAVNIKLISVILQKMSHEVSVATNGFEAIDALSVKDFDLVLMDVEMPEMDGIETTKRIRAGEAGEAKKKIPIIALTAHAVEEFKKKSLGVGMNAYITKPIDVPELKAQLQKISSGKKSS